jgi:hypothetical protein
MCDTGTIRVPTWWAEQQPSGENMLLLRVELALLYPLVNRTNPSLIMSRRVTLISPDHDQGIDAVYIAGEPLPSTKN